MFKQSYLTYILNLKYSLIIMGLCFYTLAASAQPLTKTIKQVKPSVVAVGTVLATRRPPARFMGTGFFVGDGYHVITNAHVIPARIKIAKKEQLGIFYSQGKQVKFRRARVLAKDASHDLALLRIEGTKFPALTIEGARKAQEGEEIAFMGFPIGTVLGLFPVTHRGIVSAITPVVIPAPSSSTLSVKMIKRLRHPYWVYQLDATAYPGNSGSPMFASRSGKVLGVINKVFVKETKESVIQKPSGITYAIPSKYIVKLLKDNKITY